MPKQLPVKWVLFLTALFSVSSIQAQQRLISGRVVVSNSNTPVPNATVAVRGGVNSTLTDNDGVFSISISRDDDVLEVSSIGYSSAVVPVNGGSKLVVSLRETANDLNEVVVTGYSSQRKRSITGAVSSVAGKDLVTNPSNNFAQKLQGRVAGVTVTNSPAPGGSVMVRIRGVGSVTGVNDPLYIIDGVPTRGGLTEINPNDIDDIQVLKDAAASSVYGARANNGVVLVTTKKGKSGDVRVNFNAFTGVQKSYNFYEPVTPQQYAQLRWDDAVNQGKDPMTTPYGSIGDGSGPALPDYIIPFVLEGNPLADPSNYSTEVDGPGWLVDKFMITAANKEGTDWFKECTQTAPINSYDLSISGGSDKGHFLVSGGLYSQEGILKYTKMTRYSLRINSDYNISKSIRFGENLQFGYTKSNDADLYEDYGTMGQIYSALRLQPIYDIKGNFSGNRSQTDPGIAYNPYAKLYRNKDNKNQSVRLIGNVFAEIDLFRGLSFRSNFGFDYTNYYSSSFSPLPLEDRLASQVASLNVRTNYNINLTLTNLLNYKIKFGENHDLKLLAGTEVIRGSYRNTDVNKTGFAFEDISFQYLSSGSEVGTVAGSGTESRLLSYFGKADYAFKDRYLLSATVRRDASSNFAEAKRWGTFPSFGVGWIVSDESFMKNVRFLNLLKFRGSWGVTGNQDIDPNNQYTTFSSNPILSYYDIGGTNNSVVQGFQADRIGNPLAQWEEQVMTNIGVDLSLFNDKFYFSADVYNRETRKLLLVVPVASSAGINIQPAKNVGSMRNRGIDLNLSYNGTAGKNFKFQIGGIWSAYRNKVTELYNGKDGFIQFDNQRTSTLSRTQRGYPIGMFWGYINDGIFQDAAKADAYPTQNGDRATYNQPGRSIFRNTNGDTVVNADDRTFIGSPHPKFTYGLTINLQYRNVDLAIFLQGSYGNKVFNFLKVITDYFPFNTSPSTRMLDSWTPDNPDAVLPKTNSAASSFESNANTYYIEDGSYLRGKTFSLGYTFPTRLISRIKATNARLYVQATNLFTLTKYKGIDPEVPVQNPGAGADLQYGVDKGTYPFTRTFTAGVQIGF
jgi:TonB-dependent starch-binding outer membrane protein SusC